MITRISDAPLPTPDPWAGDAPGTQRCPHCALANPGDLRCARCGKALAVKTARRRPITANLANLLVVLLGRGPMLLAISFMYRNPALPLLNPWTSWLAAQIPLLWLATGGLFLRWRWAWYLAFAICAGDLLAAIGLQLVLGGNPVLPVSAILADLMVLGFLLTVFDEVRVDLATLSLPQEANLPRTPIEAFNAGAAYGQAGLWYFAARMWQRAVALGHHEGRYRRALGMAYLHLRELAAAAAELAAARRLMPDDAQTRELLATLDQLRARVADK